MKKSNKGAWFAFGCLIGVFFALFYLTGCASTPAVPDEPIGAPVLKKTRRLWCEPPYEKVEECSLFGGSFDPLTCRCETF